MLSFSMELTKPSRSIAAWSLMAVLASSQAALGDQATKPATKTPDATALLAAAEAIRNPQDDYQIDVTLTDKSKGTDEVRTYQTLVKGRDHALVKYVTPAAESGTRVLMVGGDMWISMPTSAKPLRISPSQRLAGTASYGDVARLDFVGNYTPTVDRSDKLDGKAAFVINLVAIDGRPVTYDRVEYWIDQESKRPLKAIFQTPTGKPIREMTFGAYENVFGVQRPSEFTIQDLALKQRRTVLRFSNPQKKQFPEMMFQKQNLGRQ